MAAVGRMTHQAKMSGGRGPALTEEVSRGPTGTYLFITNVGANLA